MPFLVIIYTETKVYIMTYNQAETTERKLLKEYAIPTFVERFTTEYIMSDIGSYDRKDMTLILDGITYIVEAKCRVDVKEYYETKGLMMELTKYKELSKLYPDNTILYISFINNTHFYIHNLKTILKDFTLNELLTYMDCPKNTCEDKGRKDKAVLLLPMGNKYCKKVIMNN